MTATQVRPPLAEVARAARPAALTPPLLAALVAVAGLCTWIAGIAVPSGADLQGGSLFGLFLPVWHRETWMALPYVAFAAAALALLGLAVRPRARAIAAGALAGLAVEAYLLSLPTLAIVIKFDVRGIAAYLLMTAGAGLVATAGLLLYARAEPRAALAAERPVGIPLAAVAIAGLGALAVLASAGLPVYPDRPIALEGVERWFALEPIGLGLAGLGVVAVCVGGADRAAGSAALLGLGGLGAIAMLSQLVVLSAGVAQAHAGSWIALAGCSAIAVAGAVGLAGRRDLAIREETPATALDVDEPSRLLAAAAHLDPAFAQRAVREILRERHRALAPSSGIALGAVLRHCVAARGRHQARNVLLAALAAPFAIALVNASAWPALACFALAWAVVLTELWTARIRVAARRLSLAADHAPPPYLPPGAEAAIRELELSESRNLVVYSGYRPWVGSGAVQGGWTFAVNVRKGKKELDDSRRRPRPFTEAELHAHVAERLRATDLPTLRLADRLYVDGERVRDDPRFLQRRHGRPRSILQHDELVSADEQGPADVVRRVRSASVVGWGGEVTFTVHLDFRVEGASLYADATYCALMPPHGEYRRVDSIDPRPTLGTRLRTGAEAAGRVVALPVAAVRAAGELRASWQAWRRRSRERREIARNPRFDYGATTSLRELAQAPGYRRYFQFIDRDMFAKILEREVLDAIVVFLDEHDIDTSDLEERQAAVLNNGVIVTGGALSAQSLSVGQQARSAVVQGAHRATARGGKAA